MMDMEKYIQAKALLDNSGAKAVILLANDGEHHSAFVNGKGVDIVQCIMDCMMDNPQFGFLMDFAVTKFHEIKKTIKKTNNMENNKKTKEESNDEKIGKQLLKWFEDCNWDSIDHGTLKREDIIAWLKNRVEQNYNNMENNKKTDKENCEELRERLTQVLGVKPESYVCLGAAGGRLYGGIDGDKDELADALVMAMGEDPDVDWLIWTACERSADKKYKEEHHADGADGR